MNATAISTGTTVSFTVADLLTWKKLAEVRSDLGISSVSAYVKVSVSGTIVNQYADSVELALVPVWAVDEEPGVAEAPLLAVAIAWLWGTGPAGTPFVASDPWTRDIMRWVMSACGHVARKWVLYGRCGMAAGETATVSVTARLLGQTDETATPPFERINPLCTVPPFVPGTQGAVTGSHMIAMSPQKSISPRLWTSKEHETHIGDGESNYTCRIFGGPWYCSAYHTMDADDAANASDYGINAAGDFWTLYGASLAGAIPVGRNETQVATSLSWGYPAIRVSDGWMRFITSTSDIDQHITSRYFVHWR